jgi:hypothetical protein
MGGLVLLAALVAALLSGAGCGEDQTAAHRALRQDLRRDAAYAVLRQVGGSDIQEMVPIELSMFGNQQGLNGFRATGQPIVPPGPALVAFDSELRGMGWRTVGTNCGMDATGHGTYQALWSKSLAGRTAYVIIVLQNGSQTADLVMLPIHAREEQSSYGFVTALRDPIDGCVAKLS